MRSAHKNSEPKGSDVFENSDRNQLANADTLSMVFDSNEENKSKSPLESAVHMINLKINESPKEKDRRTRKTRRVNSKRDSAVQPQGNTISYDKIIKEMQ